MPHPAGGCVERSGGEGTKRKEMGAIHRGREEPCKGRPDQHANVRGDVDQCHSNKLCFHIYSQMCCSTTEIKSARQRYLCHYSRGELIPSRTKPTFCG